ncbi:MAG TPA: hypothetical protein DCX07_02100, partial [Phycisphaerales bacterium]|nr:hypothetical protein [Phycisphaerales bacterium]
ILGLLGLWLIVSGAIDVLRVGFAQASSLLQPILKILGGLVILAVYWYALWSDSSIRRSLENIFAIPELLRKIAFTIALLCIYRIG